jgi:hypothetical protein
MYANKKECPTFALRQVILRWVGVGEPARAGAAPEPRGPSSLFVSVASVMCTALRQAELRSRIRIVQCDNCEARDRIIAQLKRTEQQVWPRLAFGRRHVSSQRANRS